MNETLTNELSIYLGELMYQVEHEKDWMKKDELKQKINAVHLLLDVDKHHETFLEAARRIAVQKL